MDSEKKDIFDSILTEADKINRTLNELHTKFISSDTTVLSEVKVALKALEHSLEIVVRNTDAKTNQIDPNVLNNSNEAELTAMLRRIGLLSRRLEREAREHYKRLDNK